MVLLFTITIGFIILIIEIFIYKYSYDKNTKTYDFKNLLFCFNNIKKHKLSVNNVVHVSK